MKLALLFLIVLCLFAGCGGTGNESPNQPTALNVARPEAKAPVNPPAFLDAWDRITFTVANPVTPEQATQQIHLKVNGSEIQVKEVKPADKPTQAGADSIDPNKVVLPGTLQSALGGTDWNPNGDVTKMTETAKGVFSFVAKVPKGTYEYKLAKGGSWNENYGANFEKGGGNITLVVPQDQIVAFVVDFNKKTIVDSINNPDKVKAPAELPKSVGGEKAAPKKEKLFRTFGAVLTKPLTINDLTSKIEAEIEGKVSTVYAREVLDDPSLYYAGDLGPKYTKEKTEFRLWSPVSSKVELLLHESPTQFKAVPMEKGENGTWTVTVPGDLHRQMYQYRLTSYGETRLAADIHAFGATPDSSLSVVLDLAQTNPKDWPVAAPGKTDSPTDAILYELHVRDLTASPSSGTKPEWQGKYLGVAQTGTKNKAGNPTGLDYLKSLGVTHIHLLPMQDFNPEHSQNYNWGYETTLFNVPEEQYSVGQDPVDVIRETKEMFGAFHRAGLRVVMDVVYNHTVPAQGEKSAFWQTVPYFYFRTSPSGEVLNESGVGNALNDDHPMVRKYVRDSLIYWTKEYGVDGFRFDLIGMFTKDSVADWSQALHAVRSDLVIYGEPWTGGGPIRFGKGTQRGTRVAVFNDNLRNALRGELDGKKPGYAMGVAGNANGVLKGLVGSIDFNPALKDFCDTPGETINYVSAHDNMTLWDKIDISLPKATQAERKRAFVLANAVVLLSQGIPFIEGGSEMGRTKGGDANSYNGGDKINQYDWDRAEQFKDVTEEFKKLVAIRNAHPAFRLRTAEQIRKLVQISESKGLITMEIDGTSVNDPWGNILVMFSSDSTATSGNLKGYKKVAGDLARLGYVIYQR